MMSSPLIIWS